MTITFFLNKRNKNKQWTNLGPPKQRCSKQGSQGGQYSVKKGGNEKEGKRRKKERGKRGRGRKSVKKMFKKSVCDFVYKSRNLI